MIFSGLLFIRTTLSTRAHTPYFQSQLLPRGCEEDIETEPEDDVTEPEGDVTEPEDDETESVEDEAESVEDETDGGSVSVWCLFIPWREECQ